MGFRPAFFPAILLGVCASTLAACTVYHPAPLALTPPLSNNVAKLAHILPNGKILPLSQPFSLPTLGALAVLNSPDLAAARTQSGIAQASLLTAGLPADPTLSAGFAALISGPGSIPALTGGFAQDISALVTYRLNRKAAAAGLAQVNAQILWQEWQTASQAEALAIALAADNQTIATLQADTTSLTAINTATMAAVAAHNLTLSAQSASSAALAANQTALNAALQTQAQNQAQLNALLGLQPTISLAISTPASSAASLAPLNQAEIAQAIATLPSRRPDLIALRYGYTQANATLRAAILSQFLPISLGASAGRDTSNVWSVGPQLSLTLPLFNRNQGAIAAATASRTQLAAQFHASLASAEGGAEALNARITALTAQAAAAATAAAQAAATAAQAQRAFAQGALDALSATTLQTTAAERARESIALNAQLLTARLSLGTLLGLGLPPANLSGLDQTP